MKKYTKFPVQKNSPSIRYERWKFWWNTIGKFKQQKILTPKAISVPKKSLMLAEFVGILLGDGGIQKYQVVITLHRNELRYALHISKLITDLFNIRPSLTTKGPNAINVLISRINVVKFCLSIGLSKGNKVKNQCSIPAWIMARPEYQKMCLKGLVDTDGCFYLEKHRINGRIYKYPRLNFTNFSKPLIKDVYTILLNNGFDSRIRRKGKAVQLENKNDICHYFKAIGTNNSRHFKKFNNFVAERMGGRVV